MHSFHSRATSLKPVLGQGQHALQPLASLPCICTVQSLSSRVCPSVCLSSQGIFLYVCIPFIPPSSVHICLCTSSPLLIKKSVILDWDPPYSSVTHLNLHLTYYLQIPFFQKSHFHRYQGQGLQHIFSEDTIQPTRVPKSKKTEDDRVQELIRLFTSGGRNQL